MNKTENAQTLAGRAIVESLDRAFARLYVKSRALIENTPSLLYRGAEPLTATRDEPPRRTANGEIVLRAAAVIEQTFGGLTANLWDDPFEWTLPEYLSTPEKILGYLAEVNETRKRAFSSFSDDGCLLKQVALPSGDAQLLIDLLIATLMRAASNLGSNDKLF